MKKSVLLALAVGFTALAPISQAQAYFACKAVARALFGKGPKIGGTWAKGYGETPRQACRRAKRKCRFRLDDKRDATGFGFPMAECKRRGRAQPVYDDAPEYGHYKGRRRDRY